MLRHHRVRSPQLERELPIVPIAVARQVIEEASLWLGVPLHGRYAARLSFQASRCYAHSASFRAKLRRSGDSGRDLLYVFLRHWFAARLQAERPALFARLPKDYATGAPLPLRPSGRSRAAGLMPARPAHSHGFEHLL